MWMRILVSHRNKVHKPTYIPVEIINNRRTMNKIIVVFIELVKKHLIRI